MFSTSFQENTNVLVGVRVFGYILEAFRQSPEEKINVKIKKNLKEYRVHPLRGGSNSSDGFSVFF